MHSMLFSRRHCQQLRPLDNQDSSNHMHTVHISRAALTVLANGEVAVDVHTRQHLKLRVLIDLQTANGKRQPQQQTMAMQTLRSAVYRGHEAIAYHACGALFKLLQSGRRPPIAHHTIAIVLAALVVKAVLRSHNASCHMR